VFTVDAFLVNKLMLLSTLGKGFLGQERTNVRLLGVVVPIGTTTYLGLVKYVYLALFQHADMLC